MTYKDNFVAVVKCNGAILREKDGAVKMPFGAEYSILLKNLDGRPARVSITIDGEDVMDGGKIIVNGNHETELEGFMKGRAAKNRFKFIKKTTKTSEHRGDRIDDGIIRIEYQFEKQKAEHITEIISHRHVYDGSWRPWGWDISYPTTTFDCSPDDVADHTVIGASLNNMPECSASVEPQINDDEGITVQGEQINQQFTPACVGELEENAHVITIRLAGTDSQGAHIKKPVTVKTRFKCPTCGTKSRSNVKYCSECGTCLV